MSLHEYKNLARRNEFFKDLEELMSRYPEISEPVEEDIEHRVEAHGYDVGSPKILTAVVLTVTYRNADDWEDLFYLTPYGQSNFHTIGMITAVSDLVR